MQFALVGTWALLSSIAPQPAGEWQPAKTHALIVGVLEWKNGLTPYPKRDRKDVELRDLLIERGTPPDNNTLLLDKEATLPRIREAVATTAKKAEKDSTLIVYYAGHGWAAGKDYCFANYEVSPARKDTAWSLAELGSTLTRDFRGGQVFLWADCCYSGGFEIVVDALAAKNVEVFTLTSAGTANASTDNWTFTQCIIDGLRGEPLTDANADGKVTLGELHAEVRDAMRHLEGQKHGFKRHGLTDGFVLATTSPVRAKTANAPFPIGSYVRAKGRYGRVVGGDDAKCAVQFYDYCTKVVEEFPAAEVTASARRTKKDEARLDADLTADCEVEWKGEWWDAKVLRTENDRWRIHYIGYEKSWDEWVGPDRIRFKKPESPRP
jgi:hypothetical protein